MSGWNVTICERLATQSGSSRASVGAVLGTIRRLSAGGRPRMLRSCRSVVMTSAVSLTNWSLNRSSCSSASATSGTLPVPTSSLARSRFRMFSPRSTEVSEAQTFTCCCERAQYCCSMERTIAMTSALNRQTATSAFSRATTIGARLASSPLGPNCWLPPSKGWLKRSWVLVV